MHILVPKKHWYSILGYELRLLGYFSCFTTRNFVKCWSLYKKIYRNIYPLNKAKLFQENSDNRCLKGIEAYEPWPIYYIFYVLRSSFRSLFTIYYFKRNVTLIAWYFYKEHFINNHIVKDNRYNSAFCLYLYQSYFKHYKVLWFYLHTA